MTLFAQNNFDSLKLLFQLYSPIVNGLKPISDKFKSQLIQKGTELIKSVETTGNGKELSVKVILVNSQLVEKVLEVLTHHQKMILECFNSDATFERQLMLSFQEFLNLDVGKFSMSELLANYADKVLRKGGIKGDRKLIEEQLDNLALLFTYLYDKDLFLLVFRN